MDESAKLKKAFLWLCRLTLGGAFVYAGFAKLFDPGEFAVAIDRFGLLPYPLTVVAGVFLPWLELVGGAAVIGGRNRRGALLILAGLAGIFCMALASAWYRGLDISCGCFGSGAAGSLPLSLARSGALCLTALFLYREAREAPMP